MHNVESPMKERRRFPRIKRPRFRPTFLLGGSILVVIALFLTDPDAGMIYKLSVGSSTVASLLMIARGIIAVACAHYSYKALFDYPSADGSAMWDEARKGNMAAAITILARVLLQIALIALFAWSSN